MSSSDSADYYELAARLINRNIQQRQTSSRTASARTNPRTSTANSRTDYSRRYDVYDSDSDHAARHHGRNRHGHSSSASRYYDYDESHYQPTHISSSSRRYTRTRTQPIGSTSDSRYQPNHATGSSSRHQPSHASNFGSSSRYIGSSASSRTGNSRTPRREEASSRRRVTEASARYEAEPARDGGAWERESGGRREFMADHGGWEDLD